MLCFLLASFLWNYLHCSTHCSRSIRSAFNEAPALFSCRQSITDRRPILISTRRCLHSCQVWRNVCKGHKTWRSEVQTSVYVWSISPEPVMISHQSRQPGAKSNGFTPPWSAESCLLALGVRRRSGSMRCQGVPTRTRCDFIKATWSSRRLSSFFISNPDRFRTTLSSRRCVFTRHRVLVSISALQVAYARSTKPGSGGGTFPETQEMLNTQNPECVLNGDTYLFTWDY